MPSAPLKTAPDMRAVVAEAIDAFAQDPAYVLDLSAEAWKIRHRRKAQVHRTAASPV